MLTEPPFLDASDGFRSVEMPVAQQISRAPCELPLARRPSCNRLKRQSTRGTHTNNRVVADAANCKIEVYHDVFRQTTTNRHARFQKNT